MYARLAQFGVEECSVHGEGFLVDWLHMSRNGDIPINDSLTLTGESFNFLFMLVSNQLFAIVADGWIGSWNIVGVEGPHSK